MQQNYTGPKFIVLDITEIINEYLYNNVINQLFPQLTLQGFISIILSIRDTPGWGDNISYWIAKFLKEKFEVLYDVSSFEDIAVNISETIDTKISGVVTSLNVPYFWKWLGPQTLVMAYHEDPNIQYKIHKFSLTAMENYIFTTNNFPK